MRASHAISPRYAQTLRSGAGSPPIHPPWAVDSGGRGQHADGPAAVRRAEEEVSGVVLGAGKGNADVQQVLGFRQTADSSDLPKWRIQVRVLLPTPATCSLRAHLYVAGAPFACCCGRIVECARCPPRPDRQKQGERASMQSCCVRRYPIATAQRFAHPVSPPVSESFAHSWRTGLRRRVNCVPLGAGRELTVPHSALMPHSDACASDPVATRWVLERR